MTSHCCCDWIFICGVTARVEDLGQRTEWSSLDYADCPCSSDLISIILRILELNTKNEPYDCIKENHSSSLQENKHLKSANMHIFWSNFIKCDPGWALHNNVFLLKFRNNISNFVSSIKSGWWRIYIRWSPPVTCTNRRLIFFSFILVLRAPRNSFVFQTLMRGLFRRFVSVANFSS